MIECQYLFIPIVMLVIIVAILFIKVSRLEDKLSGKKKKD